MTLNVQCKNANQLKKQNVRVKIVKAPLVDTRILRSVILQRAQAVVI